MSIIKQWLRNCCKKSCLYWKHINHFKNFMWYDVQYCERTHVIREITCRIVGSFMRGSDGHEHKAQREKKHGRDSSQCWWQWGWCCTCDTTQAFIRSILPLSHLYTRVQLLTQKLKFSMYRHRVSSFFMSDFCVIDALESIIMYSIYC